MYSRFIETTHNEGEDYQLAILSDLENRTYSVVVVHFDHTHTSETHHAVATFANIYEATHEYHRLIDEHKKDKHLYQTLFDTIATKAKLYV